MTDTLPPKGEMCPHFQKPCRTMVTKGKCNRWLYHPGPSPFKHIPKTRDWMCLDFVSLFVAGEAAQQAHAGHGAVTVFREMVINPEFREKELANHKPLNVIEDHT